MSTFFAANLAEMNLPKYLMRAISFGENAIKMTSEDDPQREDAMKRIEKLKVNGHL